LLPWRALDTVAVKGRAEPVRVYTVARELDAQRRELWELHNQAMTAYYNRHFTQAIRMLNQALRIQPEDYAATLIRDRAETFRIQPPPADWSGVEVMTSK
jgi:adenylate cyclase